MKFHCCDPRRIEVLRRFGSDNAIDFVEVLDRAAPPGVPRQRTLFVRLLRDVPAGTDALTPDNLRIDGGERIRRIGVAWCAAADALPAEAEPGLVDGVDDLQRTLVVRTDSEGDFSRYTLALVANSGSDAPPPGFDPRLSRVEFSFKVECPSDFDCAQPQACPPAPAEAPNIDYLAKDYPGFRRLMLDRLSLLAPGWTERSAADVHPEVPCEVLAAVRTAALPEGRHCAAGHRPEDRRHEARRVRARRSEAGLREPPLRGDRRADRRGASAFWPADQAGMAALVVDAHGPPPAAVRDLSTRLF